MNNVHKDRHASLIPLYTYSSQLAVAAIANSLAYTKPREYASAFEAFYSMPNVSDTMRFADLEGLTGELEPEVGLRGPPPAYVDDAEHTELFDWIGDTPMEELDGYARSVCGEHRYMYLTYAAESQNPLRGYGEENLEFMGRVAEQYDPLGVLQEQVPCGFKVTEA
ncbi:uncharacterized protein BJX67DRAFT_376982 [Aspergillus lucknowensis]|uniref:Uncharacterized protein n=1 Tax=Aspergillus lucknowensis TaxID=176173 RepID=A0ABR4M6C1_9EURO